MREIHHTLARFTVARLKRFQNSIGTSTKASSVLRLSRQVQVKLQFCSGTLRYVVMVSLSRARSIKRETVNQLACRSVHAQYEGGE